MELDANKTCSARGCKNATTDEFRTCKVCRAKEAENSRRKRDRARELREKEGKVKRRRGPDKPKPPIFRVPEGGLYTLRDWEHLDKVLFSEELSERPAFPDEHGVADLIPIKMCSTEGCGDPLPRNLDVSQCTQCQQKMRLRKPRAVAGKKRKRNQKEVEESGSECSLDLSCDLTQSVFEISKRLNNLNSDVVHSAFEELNELLDSNGYGLDNETRDDVLRITTPHIFNALCVSTPSVKFLALGVIESLGYSFGARHIPVLPYQKDFAAAVTHIVDLLDDPSADHPINNGAIIGSVLAYIYDDCGEAIVSAVPQLATLLGAADSRGTSVLRALWRMGENKALLDRLAPLLPLLIKIINQERDVSEINAAVGIVHKFSDLYNNYDTVIPLVPRVIGIICNHPLSEHSKFLIRTLCRKGMCLEEISKALPRFVALRETLLGWMWFVGTVIKSLADHHTYVDTILLAVPDIIKCIRVTSSTHEKLHALEVLEKLSAINPSPYCGAIGALLDPEFVAVLQSHNGSNVRQATSNLLFNLYAAGVIPST